jgi:hypothetical protein
VLLAKCLVVGVVQHWCQFGGICYEGVVEEDFDESHQPHHPEQTPGSRHVLFEGRRSLQFFIVLAIESMYALLHLLIDEFHKSLNLRVHSPVSVDNGDLRLHVVEGNSQESINLFEKLADFIESILDFDEGNILLGHEVVVGTLHVLNGVLQVELLAVHFKYFDREIACRVYKLLEVVFGLIHVACYEIELTSDNS